MNTLFHGSDKEITKPVLGAGRADCDYGSGFYLSDDYNVAKMWAANYANGGYVNTYKIDLSNLRILWLNHSNLEEVMTWLALLCAHRIDKETANIAKDEVEFLKKNYLPKINEYDVIVGYRADDSYYVYSKAFLTNELPFELLKEAMELGNLGLQHVLISKKAFDQIIFVKSDHVPHDDNYDSLEENANKQYEKIIRKRTIHQTYLRDIIREIDKS